MLTLQTYSPSYWLLADDQLELGSDPARARLFRAHFNHSMLFNPSLLFSDSMAVNNRNFRHLIEHDQDFQSLISKGNFSIAVRTDAKKRTLNLIELKDTFVKDGKSRVTELDHTNRGLEFLERHSAIIPYSGEELSEFYSEQVVDLFLHDSIQQQLPNSISHDVHHLAKAARAELGGAFGRNFFAYQLRDRLVKHRSGKSSNVEAEVDEFMKIIKSVAEYHYITALPTKVDTTPIYANRHADAFNICRGRSRVSSVRGYDSFHPIRLLTGLASFEKLIADLPAQEILRLRESDEAAAYFKAKYEFDANMYEDSKSNFTIALAHYVRRIEDRIIFIFGSSGSGEDIINVQFDLKERLQAGLMKGIDFSPDALVYISIAAELAQHSMSAVYGLVCVLPALKLAKKAVKAAVGNPFAGTNISEQDAEYNLRSMRVQQLADLGEREGGRIDATATLMKSKQDYMPDETLYVGNKLS
jgi:hypothetical protein